MSRKIQPAAVIVVSLLLSLGRSFALEPNADPGSREDRAALFDYILAKTMERESFSEIKNRFLDLDVEREMKRYRDELIAADTDEKMYYALAKISNARKDRHLRISPVEGGIKLEETPLVEAPIRFAVDFWTPGEYFFFVSDICKSVEEIAGKDLVSIGDRLIAVNEQPISEYVKAVEPYYRYSTIEGFWWHLGASLHQKSQVLPAGMYGDKIKVRLQPREGKPYSLTLPYLLPEEIIWRATGDPQYPGFSLIFSTATYDFYGSALGKPVILLRWHRFTPTIIADVDKLMAYAEEYRLLDSHIIWDGTRSGGGSKGVYAIQRLTPKPFKTTFGNLRISDTTPLFIKMKSMELEREGAIGESGGSGAWLMDWLRNDVTRGVEAGQAYTNSVPFKLAHLPKYSDGIVKPAETHFRGRLVCLFGPHGGSHLDQFAAQVIDNQLGHTIGMSAGGYSNTWEWEEILEFPISKKPVVQFMWSIGHTIRPNGEVLEGNPAKVDEYIPVTRDNYLTYYSLLLTKALEHLDLN